MSCDQCSGQCPSCGTELQGGRGLDLDARLTAAVQRAERAEALLREESDKCVCILVDIKGRAGANLKQVSLCPTADACWWCRVRAHLALGPASTGGARPAWHVLVAAYLTDRADQYDTRSPCWVALTDAATDVVNGEVEAADANGDLDEELRARVSKWRRPAPTPTEEP